MVSASINVVMKPHFAAIYQSNKYWFIFEFTYNYALKVPMFSNSPGRGWNSLTQFQKIAVDCRRCTRALFYCHRCWWQSL